MKITFLGTRGYIDAKTHLHERHTATMLSYKTSNIIIDWGLDWLNEYDYLIDLNPLAILITHAHPDHAFGLQQGAPCPVYASKESWQLLKTYPLIQRHYVVLDKSIKIGPFTVETFSVIHSIRAPAVGYRISAGRRNIFIAHDIIAINDQHRALHNINLYIGDGASITHPIIRRKNDQLFGHSSIKTQLGWCKKEQVPYAIFTHCGSQIVQSKHAEVKKQVHALGQSLGVHATIATDGLILNL